MSEPTKGAFADRRPMKILIVDLESLFWAAAMSGSPAYDVARAVVRQIRDLAKGHDRTICATGGHEEGKPLCTGASFRAVFWPSYKADRKDRSEQMWLALAQLVEDCRAEGWLVVEAPEYVSSDTDGRTVFYEADDVVGTLADTLSECGHLITIRSDDSDLAQCVRHNVVQIRKLKTGELVTIDVPGVKAWLGVAPEFVAELKALAGDGDGYKPIPGIASGNALKMLAAVQDHTARSVRAYCEAIAEDKRNSLHRAVIEHFTPETMERAYLAARVCIDVPVDLGHIEAEPVRIPRRDVAANMVPDAEFEEGNGAPVEPSEAITPHDASARMLVAPAEAYGRMVEFQAFVKRCLVPGVDYEKYSWTTKPILLKPGAEKLAEIYGYAATFEIEKATERFDGAAPLFFYRVRCRLLRKSDRMLISECVGSCNSWESKYRDRWAYESDVPAGLDKTKLPKKECEAKSGKKYFKYAVPNPEPFDVVNTVLKMAEKRAFTGAVIIATRSGGIFGQDLDTIPQAAFGEASEARQWEA
jgi:hypothetical protein